ncbi:MAG: hypothetical protein ABUT20_58845, partial [Bacteroidota bacterium]
MKKLTFISLITGIFCTCITQDSIAQSKSRSGSGYMAPVRVGSTTLNLGIGAGSEYKNDYYNSPFGMKAAIEWGLW